MVQGLTHWMILVFLVVAAPNLRAAEERSRLVLTGVVKVIDGDTIEIGGQWVQLLGLDAPEMGDRCKHPNDTLADCGRLAKIALNYFIDILGPFECSGIGFTDYRRVVAVCRSDKFGRSLGVSMLRSGRGRWMPRLDVGGVLKGHEAYARRKGAGFWGCKAPTPRGWQDAKSKLCP